MPHAHAPSRSCTARAIARLCDSALLRPSLFKRLLSVQLVVFLGLMGVLLALTVALLLSHGNGSLDHDLKLLAQALARMSSLNPTSTGVSGAAEHITTLHREMAETPINNQELSWQVWRSDGTLLARSDGGLALPFFPPNSLPTTERTEHTGWVMMAAWNPEHSLYAVAAQSSAVTDRLLNNTLRGIVPPTLVMIFTVFLALWLAMRVGFKPLEQLARQLANRSPDATSDLTDTPRHHELTPIVNAINTLLARVRALRAAEHGFFADAAHELRTPLAAINAQAHTLAIARNHAERSVALQALQGGVGRAADVLDKLLTLARLDHTATLDTDPSARQSTDVATLLRDVLARQAPRTAITQHDLSLNAPAHLWACIDAPALTAALENLVDNALRYTPPGAQVRVSLHTTPQHTLVQIEDSGPGVAEHEHTRVFDRFERGQHSDGISGCGLGLAIVAQVAAAHHGRVVLDTSPDLDGARFTIYLPPALP